MSLLFRNVCIVTNAGPCKICASKSQRKRNTDVLSNVQECHWKLMRYTTNWPEPRLEKHKHCNSHINNCWSEGFNWRLFADPQHNDFPEYNILNRFMQWNKINPMCN